MVSSNDAPSFFLGGSVSKRSFWVGKDVVLFPSLSQCRQLRSLRVLFLRQTVEPTVTGVRTDKSFPLGQPIVAMGRVEGFS